MFNATRILRVLEVVILRVLEVKNMQKIFRFERNSHVRKDMKKVQTDHAPEFSKL